MKTQRTASLDAALGLEAGRGQPPLSKRLAIHARNVHLRAAAELLAPGASISAKAQSLIEADERYRSSRWQRDRLCSECPSEIAKTVEGHLWEARHSHDYVPLSERSLQGILAKRDR
jgi:hypothetical protein